eukprot:2575790-Karenia_brevis.AAC.1
MCIRDRVHELIHLRRELLSIFPANVRRSPIEQLLCPLAFKEAQDQVGPLQRVRGLRHLRRHVLPDSALHQLLVMAWAAMTVMDGHGNC